MSEATDFKFGVRVHVDNFSKTANKISENGRALGHVNNFSEIINIKKSFTLRKFQLTQLVLLSLLGA